MTCKTSSTLEQCEPPNQATAPSPARAASPRVRNECTLVVDVTSSGGATQLPVFSNVTVGLPTHAHDAAAMHALFRSTPVHLSSHTPPLNAQPCAAVQSPATPPCGWYLGRRAAAGGCEWVVLPHE